MKTEDLETQLTEKYKLLKKTQINANKRISVCQLTSINVN